MADFKLAVLQYLKIGDCSFETLRVKLSITEDSLNKLILELQAEGLIKCNSYNQLSLVQKPATPQMGLADLIKQVAQSSVHLTPQGKRRLTRARNDMGLPDLASAVEICAALHEALIDFIDTDGCLRIIHPTTGSQTKIQLR